MWAASPGTSSLDRAAAVLNCALFWCGCVWETEGGEDCLLDYASNWSGLKVERMEEQGKMGRILKEPFVYRGRNLSSTLAFAYWQ